MLAQIFMKYLIKKTKLNMQTKQNKTPKYKPKQVTSNKTKQQNKQKERVIGLNERRWQGKYAVHKLY